VLLWGFEFGDAIHQPGDDATVLPVGLLLSVEALAQVLYLVFEAVYVLSARYVLL
jgi:hypothetical protein